MDRKEGVIDEKNPFPQHHTPQKYMTDLRRPISTSAMYLRCDKRVCFIW
jgi:hypothetical protein